MTERDDAWTAKEPRPQPALHSTAIRSAGLRVARTTISQALPKPPAGLRWHARRSDRPRAS